MQRSVLETLAGIEGVGSKTLEKLEALNPGELGDMLEHWDIGELARRAGIKQRRAHDILYGYHGIERSRDFLATHRAKQLFSSIKSDMTEYARTPYSRRRVKALAPLASRHDVDAMQDLVARGREEWSELGPIKQSGIEEGMRTLSPFSRDAKIYLSETAVMVDGEEELEHLRDMGLEDMVPLCSVDEAALGSALTVVYLQSRGRVDVSGMDNVITVPYTSSLTVSDIVPEYIIGLLRKNLSKVKDCALVRELMDKGSVCSKAVEIMAGAGEERPMSEEAVNSMLQQACEDMNARVEESLQNVQLEGTELLKAVKGGGSERLDQAASEARAREVTNLKEELPAELLNPFPIGNSYPFQLDPRGLSENYGRYLVTKNIENYYRLRDQARALEEMMPDVEEEIMETIRTDFPFTLARFCKDKELSRPAFSVRGIEVQGLAHLGLIREPGLERVDYHLGGEDRVALLTGANSGGKTTLLEALAQTYILARMGLSVPASKAEIEWVDALVVYEHSKTLGAGAFESFLQEFLPLCTSREKVLLLADEIEAMTELDASAKIIAAFIDELRNSRSVALLVTHMADEVRRYTKVRVDGIDARGLDPEYNLLVDRTPKIGHKAHSTPELILRKILNQLDEVESGDYKRLIGKILEKF